VPLPAPGPAPPGPPPNWLQGNVVGRADPGEPPADGAPDDDPVDALPEDDPPEAPDDEPLEPPGDDEAPSAEPPSSLPVLATLPPHDATPDTMRATTVKYNQCVGRRGIVMSLQDAPLVLRLRGTARHLHHSPPTSTIELPPSVLATSGSARTPARQRYSGTPMFQAILVLAAAGANLSRPRWALLAEIALLRHQLGCQAACDEVRPHRVGRARGRHSDMEERPAHRPARDASSLAPRRLQGPLAVAEASTPGIAHRPGGRSL